MLSHSSTTVERLQIGIHNHKGICALLISPETYLFQSMEKYYTVSLYNLFFLLLIWTVVVNEEITSKMKLIYQTYTENCIFKGFRIMLHY